MNRRDFIKFLVLSQFFFNLGCEEKAVVNRQKVNKRLYIIGVDGMDPDIVSGLIEQGGLTNIKSLSEQGTLTGFPTVTPPQSPSVWTTLASGVYPERHGIYDFIQREAGSYLPYLTINKIGKSGKFENPNRAVPFWRVTSRAGIPTYIYRWPVTFPPEDINGEMLSGLGTPDVKGFLGVYTFYTDEDIEISPAVKRNVKKLRFNNNKVDTSISGPLVGKNTTIDKGFSISRNDTTGVITIDGNSVSLKQSQWTPFIKTKFRKGLKSYSGIFRFYLMSLDPFKLYATPVEITPDDPVFSFASPKKLPLELSKKMGLFHTLGMPEDTNALNNGHLDLRGFKSLCDGINKEREAMFNEVLDRFDSGVLGFVFDTSDRLQHIFYEDDGENTEIKEYYIYIDSIIGRLVKRLNPEDGLIVLSDHGITEFRYEFNLNNFLVENGYMRLKSSPTKHNQGELFNLVDWSRTRAYGLGFSGIYLNLKGREPEGIVDLADRERIIEDLKEALLNYNPNGFPKPAINLYDLASNNDPDSPDLIVGLNKGFRVSSISAIGGIGNGIITRNSRPWKADHIVDKSLVDGTFISNLKTIKAPQMVDIAPTVAAFFEINPDESWMGEKLFEN